MALAIDDFLHSFCRYLVAQALAATPSVAIAYNTSPAGLFRHKAQEAFALEPYSVAAISGGPAMTSKHPRPLIAVQMTTKAKSDVAGLIQAQTLFDAGLASDGSPLRMKTIDGYKAADDSSDGHWLLINVDYVQRPGLIGRDPETGRSMFVYNLQIGLNKIA